jgi:hypothetical protein
MAKKIFFLTLFLTKRHYNHVLCEMKRVSELLLQTKTTGPQDKASFISELAPTQEQNNYLMHTSSK